MQQPCPPARRETLRRGEAAGGTLHILHNAEHVRGVRGKRGIPWPPLELRYLFLTAKERNNQNCAHFNTVKYWICRYLFLFNIFSCFVSITKQEKIYTHNVYMCLHLYTQVNVCICIYTCYIIHTRVFFFFSGQPCIGDDEDMKEIDLPEIESDSGCPQPVPPENGFIRVSILTFTLDLESKNIGLRMHVLSFTQSYCFLSLIIC